MIISPLRLFFLVVFVGVAIACGLLGGLGNPLDVALIRAGIAARAASPFPLEAGVFLNYVGGAPATIGLSLIAIIALIMRRRPRAALWFAGIVASGRLAVEAVKLLVDRARPALDPHPVVTHSLSFPSAHAANSMIVFPALVLIFAPLAQRSRWMAVAILASLVVGASRPLLGVHWPSDVIAGWSIGAAWLLLAWSLAQHSVANELHHDVVGGHRPPLAQD